MQRPALYAAAVIFAAASLAHWLRVATGAEITIGALPLPQWLSVVAGVVLAGLAVWMVIAARRR